MESVLSFFDQGWVGSILGLLGLIVGAIGIYLYIIAKNSAKPVFQKASLGLIGRKENNLPNDVKVLFKGVDVKRLTKTKLIIWNNGTETLDGSSIVGTDPLRLEFQDEDTKILSCTILKQTRDVNKFKINKEDGCNNKLDIKFDFLDPNDGVVVEILHDSESFYPSFKGTIKGYPKGFEDFGPIQDYSDANFIEKNGKRRPTERLLRRISMILFMAIGIALFLTGFLASEQFYEELVKEEINPIKSFRMLFIGAGIGFIIRSIFDFWRSNVKYPKNLRFNDTDKRPPSVDISKLP